jgi:hypothetical protein
MSRRIAVFALAACAALTAGSARADRECFDQSCRMPDVQDPPKAAAAAADEMVDAVPPMISDDSAPPRVAPQTAADPAPRPIVQQVPRYSVDAGPQRGVQEAARPVENVRNIRVVNRGEEQRRSETPAYVVKPGPGVAGSSIVRVVPGPLYFYVAPDPRIIHIESDD